MTESLSEIVKMSAPKKVPNIFVAIPSARDWKNQFGTSLMMLSSFLTFMFHEKKINGFNIRCQPTSLLSAGRQKLLNEALESDSTHILWIDDDTKFPPEVINILLSRDVDYVAANICRKQIEHVPTAQSACGNVIDSIGKNGIEEAGWLGLGMCLIKLDAIRNIPAPHFEVIWLPEKQKYLGEDLYLCEKLYQNGVKIHVDHDVSQLIGHIGDFSYEFPKMERIEEKEAA